MVWIIQVPPSSGIASRVQGVLSSTRVPRTDTITLWRGAPRAGASGPVGVVLGSPLLVSFM